MAKGNWGSKLMPKGKEHRVPYVEKEKKKINRRILASGEDRHDKILFEEYKKEMGF